MTSHFATVGRVAIILAALASPASSGDARPVTSAADPLAPLRRLAGRWVTPDGTEATYVEYAAGTVVLEKLVMSGQSESMVTLYSADGPSVLLAHYCNRNHLSRMQTRGLAEANVLVFEFVDGANLPMAGGGYMKRLELRFIAETRFRAIWSIQSPSKDRPDQQLTFDFTRVEAWTPRSAELPTAPANPAEPAAAVPAPAGSNDAWAYAAIDCPQDQPHLPQHPRVADLLGVLGEGCAVIMFFETPRFQTQPTEDLKALSVVFVARHARLDRIAALLDTYLRKRVKFVPRSPGESVSLDLQRIPLARVLAALEEYGEIQLLPPPRRSSPAPEPAESRL
jgi:hypothetical protein